MKPCVKCPEPKPGGVPRPAAFVVNYHPVCEEHVIEALRDDLLPKADGRTSTAIPVMLVRDEAA